MPKVMTFTVRGVSPRRMARHALQTVLIVRARTQAGVMVTLMHASGAGLI